MARRSQQVEKMLTTAQREVRQIEKLERRLRVVRQNNVRFRQAKAELDAAKALVASASKGAERTEAKALLREAHAAYMRAIAPEHSDGFVAMLESELAALRPKPKAVPALEAELVAAHNPHGLGAAVVMTPDGLLGPQATETDAKMATELAAKKAEQEADQAFRATLKRGATLAELQQLHIAAK